jgi:hypothetical protein
MKDKKTTLFTLFFVWTVAVGVIVALFVPKKYHAFAEIEVGALSLWPGSVLRYEESALRGHRGTQIAYLRSHGFLENVYRHLPPQIKKSFDTRGAHSAQIRKVFHIKAIPQTYILKLIASSENSYQDAIKLLDAIIAEYKRTKDDEAKDLIAQYSKFTKDEWEKSSRELRSLMNTEASYKLKEQLIYIPPLGKYDKATLDPVFYSLNETASKLSHVEKENIELKSLIDELKGEQLDRALNLPIFQGKENLKDLKIKRALLKEKKHVLNKEFPNDDPKVVKYQEEINAIDQEIKPYIKDAIYQQEAKLAVSERTLKGLRECFASYKREALEIQKKYDELGAIHSQIKASKERTIEEARSSEPIRIFNIISLTPITLVTKPQEHHPMVSTQVYILAVSILVGIIGGLILIFITGRPWATHLANTSESLRLENHITRQ